MMVTGISGTHKLPASTIGPNLSSQAPSPNTMSTDKGNVKIIPAIAMNSPKVFKTTFGHCGPAYIMLFIIWFCSKGDSNTVI